MKREDLMYKQMAKEEYLSGQKAKREARIDESEIQKKHGYRIVRRIKR